MAKPEPLPVIKGTDAQVIAERLTHPQVRPEARKLYRGALEEYRASVDRKSKDVFRKDP